MQRGLQGKKLGEAIYEFRLNLIKQYKRVLQPGD